VEWSSARLAHGALAVLVVGSAAIRSVAVLRHSVPRLFPDEYIYAALGRAIGQGNLEIRGATAHFPAILEPVAAAPLWRLFGATTAYHLVQVENAIFVSLAAIPIYLTARWLGLDRSYALFCAAFGLLVPDLTLAAYTVSDPLGFPLILATVLAGLRALDEPAAKRQLAFLGLATLSTLDRLQYVAIIPAYLVAAVLIERRRVLRTHRVAMLTAVPGAILAAVGATGYYLSRSSAVLHLHPLALGHWMLLQSFLLTVESGVIVVPGAVAAMVRPRGRRETVFAALVGLFCLFTLFAASDWAVGTGQFKARYLFELQPLLAVAFGVYLRRRHLQRLVLGLSAAVAVALALLPLSTYTASTNKTDSEFLFGVWFLERHLGTGTACLVVALVATAGCLAAALVALGRLPQRVALLFVLAFVGALAAGSVLEDVSETSALRRVLPTNLQWVDRAAQRPVTAVATTPSVSDTLRDQLYWNTSIQREVVLRGAAPTDGFSAPPLEIARNGVLKNVAGDVLVDHSSTTVALAAATRLASVPGFTLWRPAGVARFRLLMTDRYADGWLGASGAIRAWPLHPGRAVRVSFDVSLPRGRRAIRLQIGRTKMFVEPGETRHVSCESGSGELDVAFSSPDPTIDHELRSLSARTSEPRVEDVNARPGAAASCY
jgi:hypothetical protein